MIDFKLFTTIKMMLQGQSRFTIDIGWLGTSKGMVMLP